MRTYLDEEGIRQEFIDFLMKYPEYTLEESELATSDFPGNLEHCYLGVKYTDNVTIDGIGYEQRAIWTNFIENMWVNTRGKTFCFYVFYREEDIPNHRVGEYWEARKLYSVTDLKKKDFPWYVKW